MPFCTTALSLALREVHCNFVTRTLTFGERVMVAVYEKLLKLVSKRIVYFSHHVLEKRDAYIHKVVTVL